MTMRMKVGLVALSLAWADAGSAQFTIEVQDYATLPMTGSVDAQGGNEALLARVNTLREEPGGAPRFFVPDQNGPLYILDKATKEFTLYLDFNGRDGRTGIFEKLYFDAGNGNGFTALDFDPDYRRTGKFYTIHLEDPSLPGSNLPRNAAFPGLNVAGYEATRPILTPGQVEREGVLVEWTDTDISNATFEGSAREVMRVQLNTRNHPMGDIIFNPTAVPGDVDWRVLYIEVGDGGAVGGPDPTTRLNPQRLDNLVGKILRIIPDLNEHTGSSAVSENGRYRIPNDNPFVSTDGARKEIWAYGLRNPHRLNWAIDSTNPVNNRFLANVCGLNTWETVTVVKKGANYGWPLREGTEALLPNNRTEPLPALDELPVMIDDQRTAGVVKPTYPVIQYGHGPDGGDCIGAGFLYNGTRLPALRGKYLFADITTGRVWYAEYGDMLAADDGDPATLAPIHEVRILWDDPHDAPDAGKTLYETMFPIAQAGYHARGGQDPDLPGRARVSGSGRADARLAVDAEGELYFYSKSDGMIRAVVGAVAAGGSN